MRRKSFLAAGWIGAMMAAGLLAGRGLAAAEPESPLNVETKAQRDQRMEWWREARFGMFIHWGLYAVPAGQWKGRTDHAEWIRDTAQIPVAAVRSASASSSIR